MSSRFVVVRSLVCLIDVVSSLNCGKRANNNCTISTSTCSDVLRNNSKFKDENEFNIRDKIPTG